MQNKNSKGKTIIQVAVRIALLPVLLFIPAGTLNWPEAWLFLIICLSWSGATLLWLIKNNPDLLKERLKMPIQKNQKGWDKVIVFALLILSMIWLPLPGLDAVRYQWSHVPLALKALGFIGLIPSFIIVFLTIKENAYLSTVVRIQQDRGHKVITTGPYRCVRHPMYSGMIILYLSFPLSLGSFYALIFSLAFILLIILRTHLEDRTLQKELPGYHEYAKRVRYRLVPGMW